MNWNESDQIDVLVSTEYVDSLAYLWKFSNIRMRWSNSINSKKKLTLCAGSTRITSKYLCEASCATQYELRTLKPPQRLPTRS